VAGQPMGTAHKQQTTAMHGKAYNIYRAIDL